MVLLPKAPIALLYHPGYSLDEVQESHRLLTLPSSPSGDISVARGMALMHPDEPSEQIQPMFEHA